MCKHKYKAILCKYRQLNQGSSSYVLQVCYIIILWYSCACTNSVKSAFVYLYFYSQDLKMQSSNADVIFWGVWILELVLAARGNTLVLMPVTMCS